MPTAYYLLVTLHLLAAVVWLGGMIFFALIAPILREIEDEAFRARLFDRLGRRFRNLGWICIGALVAGGIGQLHLRGWWGSEFWGVPGFWSTALGSALAWKLVMVVLMISVQAAHDFWLGPAAGRAASGSPQARTLRTTAAWLARGNAFVGLVLIYFAVRLARGG